MRNANTSLQNSCPNGLKRIHRSLQDAYQKIIRWAEAEASYPFLHEGVLRSYLSKIGQQAGDALALKKLRRICEATVRRLKARHTPATVKVPLRQNTIKETD